MIIVAFAGRAGVGKTEAAKYLVEKYGAKRLSYAAPLRAELMAAEFIRAYDKPTPPEYRGLLQFWGDCRRAEDVDYFSAKLEQELFNFMSLSDHTPGVVAIDDIRYQNEVDALREFSEDTGVPVKIIKLRRGYARDDQRADIVYDHPSEHGLDLYVEWDGVIDLSPHSLDQMRAAVDEVIDGFS